MASINISSTDIPQSDQKSIRQRLSQGAFWSVVGVFGSRGLLLLGSILLANYLREESYGKYTLILSYVATISVFAGMSVQAVAEKWVAELVTSQPERCSAIIKLSYVMTSLMSILICTLVTVFSDYFSYALLQEDGVQSLFVLGTVAIIPVALNGVHLGILNGLEAFKLRAIIATVCSALTFALPLFFSFYYGVRGAIVGFCVTQYVTALFFGFFVFRKLKDFGLAVQSKWTWHDVRSILSLAAPNFIAGFFVSPFILYGQSYLVSKGAFSDIAIFAVCMQWRELIGKLIVTLNAAYLPIASSIDKADRKKRRKVYHAVVLMSGAVSLVAALIFSVFAGRILSLYGNGFLEGVWVFRVVLLVAVLDCVSFVTIPTLLSANRTWYRIPGNVIFGLVFSLTAFLLIDAHGVLGLAGAILCAQAALVISQLFLTEVALRQEGFENSRDVLVD